MAATDHRRIGLAVVVLVLLLVVGACGGDDVDLGPLPKPAVAGLALEAAVEPRPGDGDEARADIELTVRLDPDAGHAVEVRGLDSLYVLAHAGRLADGAVVLAVGRGALHDEWGRPGRAVPLPAPPGLIEPGDETTLEATTAPLLIAGGDDAPEKATPEEVTGADVFRVCLWGARHPVGERVLEPSHVDQIDQLACVDVEPEG